MASIRYAAFLRAINVGGHNVKMDHLRELFRGMGFHDVATHIASGNVLFTADAGAPDALAAGIAGGLEEALGYGVATFLRTAAQLEDILASEALAEARRVGCPTAYVGLTAAALTPAEGERVRALATAEDVVRVEGAEIYWLPPDGKVSRSTLTNASFEKALGRPATFRNDRTVAAVAGKLTTKEKG